jgi:hypothetical protein
MSRCIGAKRACAAMVAIFVVACARAHEESPRGRSAPASDSGPTVAPAVNLEPVVMTDNDDAVRSVYPIDASAPDPLAARLCTALQSLAQTRRAECCSSTPGVLVTSECVRTLSAALHFRAVVLMPADVERCVGAMDRALAGCDWVGPNAPQPPAECQGIVHGALADGSHCRSSLECIEGLRCHGVGPTNSGRCGPPREQGGVCGATVDSLAVYVRQNEYDLQHPECHGWCNRRRCAPTIATGGHCVLALHCGPGHSCVAGTCAEGGPQAPPRKRAGETCASDAECSGACLKAASSARGTCGKKCS